MHCKFFTKIYRIAICLSMAILAFSCTTPKDVTYFSDTESGDAQDVPIVNDIKARPDDRISIVVVSKDPQLASLFNLPMVAQRSSQPGITTRYAQSSNELASYVVDAYGDIQFPVLGTLHISGMRRAEIAEYIQSELKNRNLVKDPVVIVDFLNHGVSVIGEVNKPGRITFDRDRYTLLDAIAGAGDLTIQGKRTNILVLRWEDGRQVAHRVDITNAKSVMESPVYYLQQDDVIVVSPNDVRIRQTTANGNTPLTPGFWISIASLLTTVAVLIWK